MRGTRRRQLCLEWCEPRSELVLCVLGLGQVRAGQDATRLIPPEQSWCDLGFSSGQIDHAGL